MLSMCRMIIIYLFNNTVTPESLSFADHTTQLSPDSLDPFTFNQNVVNAFDDAKFKCLSLVEFCYYGIEFKHAKEAKKVLHQGDCNTPFDDDYTKPQSIWL